MLLFMFPVEHLCKNGFVTIAGHAHPLQKSWKDTDEQIKTGSSKQAHLVGSGQAEASGLRAEPCRRPGGERHSSGTAPRDSEVVADFQELFCRLFLELELF